MIAEEGDKVHGARSRERKKTVLTIQEGKGEDVNSTEVSR
jgi:hypothetical protein